MKKLIGLPLLINNKVLKFTNEYLYSSLLNDTIYYKVYVNDELKYLKLYYSNKENFEATILDPFKINLCLSFKDKYDLDFSDFIRLLGTLEVIKEEKFYNDCSCNLITNL